MSEAAPISSLAHEKRAQIALLLDVDGVITNPIEKKVTEEGLFEDIIKALESGFPVALNTGRSNEWMIERVILPLNERVSDKSLLKNFFAVGEKGLTWTSYNNEGDLVEGVFDREGKQVEGFDTSVFLDPQTSEHFTRLEKEVRLLIDTQYGDSTFYDETKKAMISTEMLDGYDQAAYSQEQIGFTSKLAALLQKEGLDRKFNIDPTTIATDIQVPEAGKHLGARRILDWLNAKGISPERFIAIGDSASDLEMADELHNQGKNVEFKYVNPGKALTVEKPYPVVTTNEAFGHGTAEVLQEIFTS
jgi:hypothetical protein